MCPQLFLPLDSAWNALGTQTALLPWSPDIYIRAIDKSKTLKETLAKVSFSTINWIIANRNQK
jgi:hypothetical protein